MFGRPLGPSGIGDVLVRRWTFSLNNKGEVAVIMRSFENEDLLPLRDDRVRAFIHKCGYLLRKFDVGSGQHGLELTVCLQVDLGGNCAEWAQDYVRKWAVNHSLLWADGLRRHCNRNSGAETTCGSEEGGIDPDVLSHAILAGCF